MPLLVSAVGMQMHGHSVRVQGWIGIALTVAMAAPSGITYAQIELRCLDEDVSLQQAVEIAEGKRALPGPLPRLACALGKSRHPQRKRLLAKGENPNACIAGVSAMPLPALADDAEGMRLLREPCAQVDAPLDALGAPPLFTALLAGHWSSALLLLDWGANAQAESDSRSTALHELAMAALPTGADQQRWQIEAANRLVAAGSSVDARSAHGSRPLLFATAARNDMLAAWLVERGAEPQTRDDHGHSPLSIARRRGQSTLIELFEQAASRRPSTEEERAPAGEPR
jgi:hypothetical protein